MPTASGRHIKRGGGRKQLPKVIDAKLTDLVASLSAFSLDGGAERAKSREAPCPHSVMVGRTVVEGLCVHTAQSTLLAVPY